MSTQLRMIPMDDPMFEEAWGMLLRSIEGSGQTEEDVKLRISNGSASVWVLVVDGRVAGAVVTAVDGGVLFIMHLAATKFSLLSDHWQELIDYGTMHGTHTIRGRCTPAAAKIFNSALGSKTIYCVVEQAI